MVREGAGMMRHWSLIFFLACAVVILVWLIVEQVLHIPLMYGAQKLIDEPGVFSALAVVGFLSVDLLLPVPSSLVMVLSGAMFGVVGGALLSLVGSLAGNVLGFEIARRYGVGPSTRLVGAEQVERMSRVFSRYGIVAVILSRPVPVVMEALSVVCGLAGMNRRAFLVASLIGTVPICVAYAYAGSFSSEMGNVVPVFLAVVGIPALGWLLWKRKVGRSEGSDVVEDATT